MVIDGATPELAEAAEMQLYNRISQDKFLFHSVRQAEDGDFFNHNGMLFLPLADVQNTTQQLFRAQAFLGPLAADPSLRGILTSLSNALTGVSAGQAKLADLDVPISLFAEVSAPPPPARCTICPGAR